MLESWFGAEFSQLLLICKAFDFSFILERFNKDIEEIKKSQYIMNNAINEIKNTLEGTNSRITEAEDRIRELEDRMVEIN